MKQKISSLSSTFVKKIGSSRPGAWLFARIGHHLDGFVLRRSSGRKSITSFLGGVPVVSLTTTGAKSGLPRTLPLMAIRDPQYPQNIAFIASNWGQGPNPSWYYNLKAHPHAKIMENGRASEYMAHEAHGAEYEKYWHIASKIYEGYPKYKHRNSHRHIPIMVLTPVGALETGPESVKVKSP